jgi:hypothetical protein
MFALVTMSTGKKSRTSATTAPAPTKGVIIARAHRSDCNTHSNDQRAALVRRAMNIVHSGSGSQRTL